MKVWYENNTVKCLSEMCTRACPRFNTCTELNTDEKIRIKMILELSTNNVKEKLMKKFIGKKVIVRGDRSGVFFGTLESVECQEVILKNARKLWRWVGAAAVEQLSLNGVSNPNDSKFTVTVDEIGVSDMIQILPCTEQSIKCIEGVEEWKR